MRGREAARRLAWADAYTALSQADQSSSLGAEDLELLATAAYLLGRMEDCHGGAAPTPTSIASCSRACREELPTPLRLGVGSFSRSRRIPDLLASKHLF